MADGSRRYGRAGTRSEPSQSANPEPRGCKLESRWRGGSAGVSPAVARASCPCCLAPRRWQAMQSKRPRVARASLRSAQGRLSPCPVAPHLRRRWTSCLERRPRLAGSASIVLTARGGVRATCGGGTVPPHRARPLALPSELYPRSPSAGILGNSRRAVRDRRYKM